LAINQAEQQDPGFSLLSVQLYFRAGSLNVYLRWPAYRSGYPWREYEPSEPYGYRNGFDHPFKVAPWAFSITFYS